MTAVPYVDDYQYSTLFDTPPQIQAVWNAHETDGITPIGLANQYCVRRYAAKQSYTRISVRHSPARFSTSCQRRLLLGLAIPSMASLDARNFRVWTLRRSLCAAHSSRQEDHCCFGSGLYARFDFWITVDSNVDFPLSAMARSIWRTWTALVTQAH